MNILALENSAAEGSIAWRNEGEMRAATFANDRRHSGAFFETLESFRDSFAGLDLIVVGLGPGSYAGTRIAIGAAIGLQAATGAQLGGLPSLGALADSPNEYRVLGDARRQTFFLAHVRDGRLADEIALLDAAAMRDRLAQESTPLFSAERLADFPQAALRFPSASRLVDLAAARPNELSNPPLEPMYLRAPHITMPRPSATL